ncbi:MAG: radical SAM protein [Deltaproteobacteria bacterium]|nr:radical SAM protein [Deltaproteobacteria bacterium]
MRTRPGYISLYETGELFGRIAALNSISKACALCPRRCAVDRTSGEKGVCGTGFLPIVSSAHPHFGEEPPLTGFRGSGTIFLTHCNLRCIFCQNSEISRPSKVDEPREVSIDELSSIMLSLQRRGCHNINFVSPTHQVPQIVEALPKAIENGLDLPLIYNTGGYDDVDTIRLLEGIFDIYMPDMKYAESTVGLKLSGVADYAEANRSAVKEMHRQVGDLVTDESGIAVKGLLVRHLVLPEGLAGSYETMRFIADEISPCTYVNIMDQYRPCFRAFEEKQVSRRITGDEYRGALDAARRAGLKRMEGAS